MEGIMDEDGMRRYYGKYPGVVIDDAAAPGGEHRGDVLVEVPAFLEDQGPGGGRAPMRVTARPCFPPGVFWVPPPGQPVWVEFAAGRLDQAIWSGVWYAAGKTPHTDDDAAPGAARRVVRTPGGHVVDLDDTDGKRKVVVSAGGDVEITARDQATLTITAGSATITIDAGGVSVDDGNQHTITMTGTGISVGGNSQVALKGLLDVFQNHKHVTSMGPAALSPDDLARVVVGSLPTGDLLSQTVTVG